MEKSYDVIVVGAGNGGLAAAAMTAKAGLKTLLLEKHNIPGGCATSFVRGRFEFEPSLHELCSVGKAERPGTVYKIFQEMGAEVDWRYEENMFRVIAKGEDGYDVTVKSGIEGFCDSIEAAVPGSRESVKALFDVIASNQAALDYITKKKGHPNKLTMVLKYGDFMRSASHSVEDVMDALGIPKKAQNIINTYWCYLGVPTDELNSMHYLSMFNGYVREGAAMPYMRSHELSLSIVKVIEDHGGEVWYNSPVTEFLFDENKRVIGVVANGEKLYAKEVISNIIPNNVFNMTDVKNLPPKDVVVSNAREFGCSIFTVYLGMDCTMEELGIEDYTTFVVSDPNPRKQFEKLTDGGLYIVNCLNKVIPDATPKGTCTLFFSILMKGSDLPEDLTPENYKKYKSDFARKYIEDYEKLSGIDIQSHIEEISIASPVTFARYLGTPEGSIYGYHLSGWDSLMARMSSESKEYTIPGLTFVGGHAARGDGYSSAYIIGSTAGKRVAARIKEGMNNE